MNRQAVGPQSLRGLPNGFPSQQQLPQNRSVSSRLPPSGKMSNNANTWAFGGMGAGGLGNPRPNNGHMTSFAQTIGGSSQPATPLDLSEFPSLSNNQPQHSQSAWAASGSRNTGHPPNLRLQQSSLSSQQQLNAQQQTQQQQDDLFSSSSQLPSVQDRNSNLMQTVGFGAQSNAFGSVNPPQANRSNGLLNALSGNNRAASGNRVASPTSISVVSNSRSPVSDHPNSFSNSQFDSLISRRDENNPTMGRDASARPGERATLPSQDAKGSAATRKNSEDETPEYHDPLAGMSEADKYGLKGLTFMMQNYPDYAGLVTGTDITNLGFDLNSTEPFSTQIYSLFDNEPARPPIPNFQLPDCYRVLNIAPLDTKVTNFNEESLIYMFYTNPGGIGQLLAANELHTRNWRFHKKLQLWLTKDDSMVPQSFGNSSEHGYYIFFDHKSWQRERREFTLVYDELEQTPPMLPLNLSSVN